MPIASPRTTLQAVRGSLSRFVVLFGADGGEAPTLEEESPHLELLGFSTTSGGSRVDSIQCRYNLAKSGERLQDTAAPVQYHRQIEVRRLDEDNKPSHVVAWGFVSSISEQIDGSTESLILTAKLDPYVFGKPLTAQTVWDVSADDTIDVHWPIVFNPEIDGIIEGNRSGHRENESDDPPGPYVFVSPESIRTGAARVTAQDNETGSKWQLSEAAHRILWSCNPDETFIKNPSLDELQSIIAGDDDIELKNFPIEYGRYLPETLDALLRPHGFGWYLYHTLEDDPDAAPPEDDEQPAKRRVTNFMFYKRGDGYKAKLLMQRVGDAYDLRKTNVGSYSRTVGLSELANRVIVRGGWKRYEGTFPMVPGWADTYDSKDLGELALDQTFGQSSPAVGRKYVVNCAGDYCDPVREDEAEPYDFADDLPDTGTWIFRRRRLRPCLSQTADGDDKKSYGHVVEWWDRNTESATDPNIPDDPGWQRVREPFQMLEHEAGVWFNDPPGRLWQLVQEDALETPPEGVDFPGLWLRITASVDADKRLEAIATRTAESANGETLTLYLDMADQFHYRQRNENSVLANTSSPDEIDDQERIQTYANKVRDLEQSADVSCSIVLPGVDHHEFEIGQLIDSVDGRNLKMTASNPDAETQRALQIVGFNFIVGSEQKTEILVETFQKERAFL